MKSGISVSWITKRVIESRGLSYWLNSLVFFVWGLSLTSSTSSDDSSSSSSPSSSSVTYSQGCRFFSLLLYTCRISYSPPLRTKTYQELDLNFVEQHEQLELSILTQWSFQVLFQALLLSKLGKQSNSLNHQDLLLVLIQTLIEEILDMKNLT